MATAEVRESRKERLEDFIDLARSGKKVKISVSLRREIVRQLAHPEESDDMNVENDLYLLVAVFSPAGLLKKGERITKVYALSPLNESEVDEKTTVHIANERLRADYQRLHESGVSFEETYF